MPSLGTATALELNEVNRLLAADGETEDLFGYSVSVSGNTAVIGAFRDDDNGDMSGSAYVFVQSEGVWAGQAKLTVADGAEYDGFGISVSVSDDTAMFGASEYYANGSAYTVSLSGPQYLLGLLQGSVLALDASKGVVNSLNKRVEAILKQVADDNPNNDSAAADKLVDFIDDVSNKSGNKLTEEDADRLIDQAAEILELLEN